MSVNPQETRSLSIATTRHFYSMCGELLTCIAAIPRLMWGALKVEYVSSLLLNTEQDLGQI